jgi:hypothetical protein
MTNVSRILKRLTSFRLPEIDPALLYNTTLPGIAKPSGKSSRITPAVVAVDSARAPQ